MSSVDQPHIAAAVQKLQARVRAQAVRKEPRRAVLNFHTAAAVLRFKAAALAGKGYAPQLGTNLRRKEKETTALLPEDTGRPMFMFGEAKHPQRTVGGDLSKRWEMGKYEERGLEKRRIRHAIVEGRPSVKKHIEPVVHRQKQWGDTRARVAVPGKYVGYRNQHEVAIEKEMQPRRAFHVETSVTGSGLGVRDGKFGTLESSMARRRKFATNGTQLSRNAPKTFMADASLYPSHFKKEQEAGLLMQQLRFSGGKAVFALSGLKGKYRVFNGLYAPEEDGVVSAGDRPVFRFKDPSGAFNGTPVFLYYCKPNGGRPALPPQSERGGGGDGGGGEDSELGEGDALDALDAQASQQRRQGNTGSSSSSSSSRKVAAAAAASAAGRADTSDSRAAARKVALAKPPPDIGKAFEGWLICVGRSEAELGPPKRRPKRAAAGGAASGGMWVSSTGGGAETPMNVGRWQTWDGSSWAADKDVAAHFAAWPWALKETVSHAQKRRETEREREVAEVEALLDFDEWDRRQAADAE